MKHSFTASKLDNEKGLCLVCKRGLIAHTSRAECEACGKLGSHEIFGRDYNPRALLLCEECIAKEEQANSISIAVGKVSQELSLVQQEREIGFDGNEVINRSREIDSSVRINGDGFTVATVPYVEIKKAIELDDTIPAEQKPFRIHELVMERIESFKPLIRKVDDEKHELVLQQYAGIQFLRAYGNEVRSEIRERIKQSSPNYDYPKPEIKIPRIKPQAMNPFDRIAQQISIAKGITIDEARKQMKEKGLL